MKNNTGMWVVIAFLVIIGAYFGYTKYSTKTPATQELEEGTDTTMMEETTETTFALDTQNDLGQSGMASIGVDANGQVVVTLALSGGEFAEPQPAHIHVGSCPEPGAVAFPLTSVVDGASVTTLEVGMDELLAADTALAINVHKSADEVSVYTACGDLPVSTMSDTSMVVEEEAMMEESKDSDLY